MSDKNLERKAHEGRADLIGEHKWGDMGQMILLIVFLANWIADTFFLQYSTFLAKFVPFYIRLPIAIILIVLSIWFAKAGLDIVFGEVREKLEVIQKGVFGIVRHPVYFGAIVGYLGLFISSFSLSSFVLFIIIFLFYNYVASYEEKLLIAHLGDAYLNYKKQVSRWIPKLRRG